MASLPSDFDHAHFLMSLQVRVGLESNLSVEFGNPWLTVRFLEVFLSCRGNHNNIENTRNFQALLVRIRTVFQSLDLDIRRCRADFKFSSEKESKAFDLEWDTLDTKGWQFPMNMVDLLSSVQQRLELLKPDIHEIYTILSKSTSRSTLQWDSQAAMKNLSKLSSHIFVLPLDFNAGIVKTELKYIFNKLIFLAGLLGFTMKRCSKLGKLKDLIIHTEFQVDKISCLLYMCSFNEKMNDSMENEMATNLSSELENFSPEQPHVRQMYINALKSSKLAQGDSVVVDEFCCSFLYDLQFEIEEIPDTNFSFTASNRDLILSLYEELECLATPFADFESLNAEIPKFSNYSQEGISAAIIDMGCLIFSLYNGEQNTDEANELKIAVSDLQDTIETVKEDARKAFDTYIPKSWHLKTKFRRTNAEGILPSQMISKLKSSLSSIHLICKAVPKILYREFKKEMLSLIEGFRNLTAKLHVEHEELEIQMMRLNEFRIETESFVSSLLHGLGTFWSQDLWLCLLIDEIRMIKMEIEDLENKMVHDTSVRKVTRKTKVEVKTTAIDYPVISEGKKKGEQIIDGSKSSHVCSINDGIRGIEDQIKWLETNLDLICPLKNEVKELRLRAGFLEVLLSFKGMWHAEDGNLKVLLTRIDSVLQNVNWDLQRLWADMIQISPKKGLCLPVNMDCLVPNVLARLRLLKPDIQEVYITVSKSSRFIAGMSDEAVMENLNSLQENIEVLLKRNTELVAPLKEELEAVQKSLRFLRNFLGFTAKRCGNRLGKLKDVLIYSEFLASKISCLLYLCCANEEMNDWTINELKMHLLPTLQKPDIKEIYIRALKASNSAEGNSIVMDEFDLYFLDSLRGNLLELSDTNLSFITANKDQILSLLEKLKFLITFFAMDKSSEQHSAHDHMSNYLLQRINAVIIDIGCVIYSLNNDEKNENMVWELELNKKVSDFEAIISIAEEDTRKMYDLYVPKSLRSNFPRTNGHGFIGSLLRNLKELSNTKADLVAPLEHHIEIVQKQLVSLSEDFCEISKQHSQCEELQSKWTNFLDIAYQTEYVIDSFLGGDGSLYCHKLGLFNVIEDIKTIQIDLKAMENKMTDGTSIHKPCCFSTHNSEESERNAYLSLQKSLVDEKSKTKLVIFEEEAEKIREQLIGGSKKLNILSIVGMPGIGKTTLADSVFQHSSVAYHFHVRARCSVSQVHDKKRLLLEILQQIPAESKRVGDGDDDNEVDDDNEGDDKRLYQSLKGRRYLILMDDVWNIRPWEDIKDSLPDDENGSRIIFTSRFENIDSQTMLESTKYHLSPLSQEKCWKMLKVKLFGNRSCPLELEMIGRELASNCKGLPLTVDLIAGVLQVKERENWKKVAKSFETFLLEDSQGLCRKVLELSYQNMPDVLKPCFLYFAAFPEDANVPTSELILLWIAEGFVQLGKDELESLEAVAQDILNDLINRNLIIVSRRGPLGEVDASQVHDLLHEFVVAKAQEESFMLKIDGKAKNRWREQYRMCIYPNYWKHIAKSKPSGPRTRTLISSKVPQGDFSLNFSTFKLLRVLYIHQAPSRCPEMFTLIHLRLLVISSFENSHAYDIISNIHKLCNLETVIMYCGENRQESNWLLDKICSMVKLRHFCFEGYISIRYLSEEIWQKASFANLQTLYTLKVSYEEDIEKILELMPNLVELKVLFYNPDGEYYPKLDFLKKLELLEVTHEYDSDSPYPCKIISFPPRLKRLVLSNFGVPWTEISEIGNHEYLEVLELKKGALIGRIWEMIDGQFPKLKFLSLSDLDIEEWYASKEHLSWLKQLHVSECRKLKELPSCLDEVESLRAIKLSYCTKDVEKSAKRIKAEQDQLNPEQLVVNINEW